ncbi:hypothetical protein RAS2_28000 [Phycisphaerae bacterium RAS2]|nr:hypothetical protein RAS2_28000 [Phycisphaerae bacterium RAS2]
MGHPAAGFERYERLGESVAFDMADDAAIETFDARRARARCLPLMDRVAAAALCEGRDIDDIECERWVEIGESTAGPWRAVPLETVARELNSSPELRTAEDVESAGAQMLFLRAVRVRGTIHLTDRL